MENQITFMQLSSLHKVFLNENISVLTEQNQISALKGERVSYQILYRGEAERWCDLSYEIKKDNGINLKVSKVGNVPSELPARRNEHDEFYLSIEPGLFPDVLYPENTGKLRAVYGNSHSLFITAEIPEDLPSGVYPIEVKFTYKAYTETPGADAELKDAVREETKVFEIRVLDGCMPKQELIYTQWFYADCISSFYGLEPLSEEHWVMMEKFVRMAAYTGINLILTPLYTVPLDTEVGRERPTVQLVDIKYIGGKYEFGFEKLSRWINMCKKYGIENFEMPHLFTQWGSGCTPKIEVMTENGKEKRFGWHVKADTPEYREFLKAFIPALTEHLKAEGVYDNTYFHISDEPNYERDNEIYRTERKMVDGLIPDDKIMDAMSHLEFCDEGLIKRPIPLTCAVDEFVEKGYKDIWAYYCCGPCDRGYGNRLIAMPSGRNRIIGFQLYKYDINGFLHWGYNFYYSELSRRAINPFTVTDADEGLQSGDSYSVYPGEDGPLESLRSVVFYEGIQDLRACKLLEEYIGRDEVLKIIEQSGEIKFNKYPGNDAGVLDIRRRINDKLEQILG